MVTIEDIEAAVPRIAGAVQRTPLVYSDALSRATGARILLKLENLQATGAFKERGAANRIALLSGEERARGVIAMSAGNHAQAVARHAQLAGIAATIVMPRFTPTTKVMRTRAWGARVVLHGETLAEAASHAHELALAEALVFVHPYDDPAVIAGQGTMALEIIEDAADLDIMVVPTGGGGFLSGCAIAARARRPSLTVLGVEVESYAGFAQALAGKPIEVGGATIAEGIAVRDIGRLPLSILRDLGTEVLVVPEAAVEQAIALLIEGSKLVAEGAGAAGLAAVLTFPDRFAGKTVALPICGGNIDTRTLANTLLRNLLRDGRILKILMEIPDRPGVLADIAARIGNGGGNIIEVVHQRLFASPTVQAAHLEIMIEARDAAHGNAIVAALEEVYTVRRM
ncbi:MAG: threonine ammonia-lyase [Acidiphilium sp. 37-64-53]|uniref:threonine ammonia-lyase n=2 Tax=Acidocellaceae TaxID=3385905 RepID=UPI000BD55D01|nr:MULTISPECIES: threonine ammonia-lyase [Acidiphilium]OYW02589.1 MAG: threonine ammonia-lyase [Acidiphilium sp. 37-64-53]OZB29877.1 MAG: threonine ammonia-lyase [Acidiphilium sp. 34-64-41]HQT84029.1 threonine ammonia-lyase [Acidiphilium rubrum]